MMNDWIKTDDTQFVKKIDDKIFEIINILDLTDIDFIEVNYEFQYSKINLNDFDEEDIKKALISFGYEYKDGLIKQEFEDNWYSKKISNQLIAEIISETDYPKQYLEELFSQYKGISLDTLEEVNRKLEEYGIN